MGVIPDLVARASGVVYNDCRLATRLRSAFCVTNARRMEQLLTNTSLTGGCSLRSGRLLEQVWRRTSRSAGDCSRNGRLPPMLVEDLTRLDISNNQLGDS